MNRILRHLLLLLLPLGSMADAACVSGTTHASINTRNLVILDRAAQETLTGKPLEETLSEANRGIWTDTAAQHSGAVTNRLKGEQGLQQLMRDSEIAQQFDQTRQQVGNDIHQRQEHLKAQYDSGQISAAEYQRETQNLENAKLLVETIAAGLNANGTPQGLAAAALNPSMANTIGQHYKNLAAQNPDGKLTPAQKAEQALAHSLLAGVVAQANGGNALSAAFSAGSTEFAAGIVSQALYGTSDPQNLSAQQKANLLTLMRTMGAAAGGATGDLSSIVPGGLVAGNAVNNNHIGAPSDKAVLVSAIVAGDKAKVESAMLAAGYSMHLINEVHVAMDSNQSIAEISKILNSQSNDNAKEQQTIDLGSDSATPPTPEPDPDHDNNEQKTFANSSVKELNKDLDKISIGRTTPKNLKEKLAMDEVKSNPQGTTPPRMPKMSDSKNGLFHEDGWVKRTQNVNGVEIHYVENIRTGKKIDFKFKDN